MKEQIEAARQAIETAKQQLDDLRKRFPSTDLMYEMGDDAYLATG